MIEALEAIELLDMEIADLMEETGINKMQEQRADLDAKVKAYVLDKGNLEVPGYKLTRVQGFKRAWDGVKLARLLPKGLFLKVVDYTPNSDKIDELVKAGKVDAKAIQSAYIETPNAPYVKITKKAEGDDGAEAERVAKALA